MWFETVDKGEHINFRLTKHGRRQYLKRVNPDATDHEILVHAVMGACCGDPDYTFIWKYDLSGGEYTNGSVAVRLVTVMPRGFYISDPGITLNPVRPVARR